MSQLNSQPATQQYFTVNEAANYLRVSRYEIYSYMRSGQLPYYTLSGGQQKATKQPRRRLRRQDLDALLSGPFNSTPRSNS